MRTIIYDGLSLLESQPLNFYQLVDGAILIAISKSERQQFEIWSRMSSDIANDTARLCPKMSKEIARLRDVRFFRIENSSKATIYHKIMKEMNKRGVYRVPKKMEPTVLCDDENKDDKPSEDPLPILW